jgi:hypothetical protein
VALWAEWMAVLETVVGEGLAKINTGVFGGHVRVPVKLPNPFKTSLAGRSNSKLSSDQSRSFC